MNTKLQAVRQILKENAYLTLATTDQKGTPWITPLFFATDDKNNLYWYSRKDAWHSKNLAARGKIAAVIYDSSLPPEKVRCIYLTGLAKEVRKLELTQALIPYAIKLFAKSKDRNKFLSGVKDFLGSSPLRMYRLTPEKIWLLGKEKLYRGKYLDYREKVYPSYTGLQPRRGEKAD